MKKSSVVRRLSEQDLGVVLTALRVYQKHLRPAYPTPETKPPSVSELHNFYLLKEGLEVPEVEEIDNLCERLTANQDDDDKPGPCLECGRQCNSEGICRKCADLECLLDAVDSDIFTDAVEYAERVAALKELARRMIKEAMGHGRTAM